jgi:TRAP-type mannitol/chloroaromatic compound transport system permease small subunit
MIDRFVYSVDQLSKTVGHAFAWCVIILTFGTSYEVFVRYVLNNPTDWAYDLSYLMYGALFIMSGAYTLSRNGHVRGDVIFRLWPVRVQAGIELVLYILFFFPGVLALIVAGWGYAYNAYQIGEASINSPIGVPVWQLKMLIPAAAALLALQGVAEVLRCVLCLRRGQWPPRLHDVEELETAILRERQDAERAAAEAARMGIGR